MKTQSLSETMDLGTPCNLTMVLTKAYAALLLVKSGFKAIKWPNLDNRSTTTHNGGITMGRRQVSDEVHGNILPNFLWNWQWLQQPRK